MDRAREHPVKRFSDWYELGEPTLCERYLNSDVGFSFKVRCRLTEGDTEVGYLFIRDFHSGRRA